MGEAKELMKEKAWSFSRLSTYESCPHSWKLQYIDKKEQEQNAFAFCGSLMHKAIEDILNGEKTPQEAAMDFREDVWEAPPLPKFLDGWFYKMQDNVSVWLSNFKMPSSVMGVEPAFEITFGDDKLKGFIDLVTHKKDVGIVVTDWKISKMFSGDDVKKKRRQIYLYGAACEQLYGEKPKRLVFVFPKDEGKWLVFNWNEYDYQEALEWGLSTAEKIKEETEWEPKEDVGDFFCENLCGVRKHCKFYQEWKNK